ncbi:amidohydrolase family protein [Aureimonas fodinaquatilis]|uniref:Amidohydrolase family protein n=1 Tax=Aureimonas fodinaquatilis TaxID=2565783 RepID=A0A5B0DRR1_9HYPH|nr:amidohydrolase family protein [Aureimonas fodinaquatilis]KAA0969487.1 amidohydrolase family protein [Aureimonas fodinaquatilis]
MKTAIVNIGRILTGDIAAPTVAGDAILLDAGLISSVGTLSASQVESADVVIDAAGTIAIPGLIDSHVHITFGDYTPRQKTVGYLESYTHGGVTSSVSASEVHVPGRPKDPAGVKALAVAAMKSFQTFRPGGMKVHAGAVILEPGLTAQDMVELKALGLRYAKAGFGAFETPFDYAPIVKAARDAGLITMAHTGGSSIPGSSGVWAEHILAMNPHVSFHVNGGPIAMPEAGFRRLVDESDVALQICTAGNLRTALLVAEMARSSDKLDRLLVATDTPTGSGIMPLGILYTLSHLCSLGGLDPELAFATACGNNARVFDLNSGFIAPGRDGDIVLIDACAGGSQDDALSALRNGDIPAVSAVITDAVPRFVGRSRNTPAGIRKVRTASSKIVELFEGGAH